uniref:Uncharacterized protein n=1 Tax=Trichuris muris TaxID=70415 RepID=A0A5S6QJP1_TRIMR
MAQRTGYTPVKESPTTEPPSRPVVMPQVYNGEGSWEERRTSFELCGSVNRWSEEDKLQWLAVCLTGNVAWAYQQLAAEQLRSYSSCVAGLKTLLIPPNVEQLNVTLFRARHKAAEED